VRSPRARYAWAVALMTVWPAPATRAEVRSLTLGISTNCPYGLAE
jgi:hypothetical protein